MFLFVTVKKSCINFCDVNKVLKDVRMLKFLMKIKLLSYGNSAYFIGDSLHLVEKQSLDIT